MLQDLVDKLKAYFLSDYLRYAMLLILIGYFLAYALAWLLARAGRADRTILYSCRRAWGIALLVHALAVTGFTIKWFFDYGFFPSFWIYFPWYLGMIILDLFIIVAAFTTMGRFANYDQ